MRNMADGSGNGTDQLVTGKLRAAAIAILITGGDSGPTAAFRTTRSSRPFDRCATFSGAALEPREACLQR